MREERVSAASRVACAECGGLGGLALGRAHLGEPDLVEDAAADVPSGLS
jgi:hypothetical protein